MEINAKRLFFALLPDSITRTRISDVISTHLGKVDRPTPFENLHLTLAFLGNVNHDRISCLNQIGAQIQGDGFVLILDKLTRVSQSGMVWLTTERPIAHLLRLVEIIGRNLRANDFSIETRPFKPHVTLARKSDSSVVTTKIRAINWPVDSVCLMESNKSPKGSCYRVLRSWPLAVSES